MVPQQLGRLGDVGGDAPGLVDRQPARSTIRCTGRLLAPSAPVSSSAFPARPPQPSWRIRSRMALAVAAPSTRGRALGGHRAPSVATAFKDSKTNVAVSSRRPTQPRRKPRHRLSTRPCLPTSSCFRVKRSPPHQMKRRPRGDGQLRSGDDQFCRASRGSLYQFHRSFFFRP
jgi:hypothetical protein